MSVVPATATAPNSASKRLVLLLMAVTSAGYVCRVAVTVVAPNIMSEFGLTQAQMGTVFSAFLVGTPCFKCLREDWPTGSAPAASSWFFA
jgi:hypothetical protein